MYIHYIGRKDPSVFTGDQRSSWVSRGQTLKLLLTGYLKLGSMYTLHFLSPWGQHLHGEERPSWFQKRPNVICGHQMSDLGHLKVGSMGTSYIACRSMHYIKRKQIVFGGVKDYLKSPAVKLWKALIVGLLGLTAGQDWWWRGLVGRGDDGEAFLSLWNNNFTQIFLQEGRMGKLVTEWMWEDFQKKSHLNLMLLMIWVIEKSKKYILKDVALLCPLHYVSVPYYWNGSFHAFQVASKQSLFLKSPKFLMW